MNCQIVQDDLHIHGGVVEQVVCQGDVIFTVRVADDDDFIEEETDEDDGE